MTVSVNLPIAISCATRGGCASSLKKRRVSPPLHPAAVSVRRLLRSRIQHRAQRPLAGVSETTKGGGMAKLMEDTLKGTGTLRRGTRTIGPVAYTIQLDPLRGHATVVQFDKKPAASGGDLVHLTLEDGAMVSPAPSADRQLHSHSIRWNRYPSQYTLCTPWRTCSPIKPSPSSAAVP